VALDEQAAATERTAWVKNWPRPVGVAAVLCHPAFSGREKRTSLEDCGRGRTTCGLDRTPIRSEKQTDSENIIDIVASRCEGMAV